MIRQQPLRSAFFFFFETVYIVSPSNTNRQISGNSTTTASVHSVTVDESDSGPTAANYDAYQHLHTHTHTYRVMNIHSQHGKHTQCLNAAARICKTKANLALVCIIIYTNANQSAEQWLIDISPHYKRSLLSFPRLDYVILVAGYFLGLFVCLCKVCWNVYDKGVSWKNSFQTDSQE